MCIRDSIMTAMSENRIQRDVFGINPILHALQTAEIAVNEIGLKRDGVIAIISVSYTHLSMAYISSSQLTLYFTYLAGDSITEGYTRFSGTEEVLQTSTINNDKARLQSLSLIHI